MTGILAPGRGIRLTMTWAGAGWRSRPRPLPAGDTKERAQVHRLMEWQRKVRRTQSRDHVSPWVAEFFSAWGCWERRGSSSAPRFRMSIGSALGSGLGGLLPGGDRFRIYTITGSYPTDFGVGL